MDPVTAAKEGNLLVFALAVSAILLTLAGSAIWWLLKARMADRYQRDRMVDDSLAAGRSQFAQIREMVDKEKNGLLPTKHFEKYCTTHEREHEKITENMGVISQQIQVLDGKMDASKELLSRLVILGKENGK